jgi:hypothetical protein
MVTVKKVNKQNLCDDLMVENLKQAQRIAALEAMVASLRINQQLKAEIAALATELQDFNDRRVAAFGRVTEIVAKMRQLSAV